MNQIVFLLKTGFFHIFGSSVLNKIIAFSSNIILVHILSKNEFGIFTYAWNIYSIVLLFNGLGLEYGVLQICSEKSGDNKFAKIVSKYSIKKSLQFDILLLLVLLLTSFYLPLKLDGARVLLVYLCCLPMIQIIFNISTSYLRSQKLNQAFARITFINTLMLLIFSIIGSYLYREKGLVFAYYLSYIVSIAMCIKFCDFRFFEVNSYLDKKIKKTLISISSVSMLNNALSQLLYLLDIFVLGVIISNESVLASYKVATIIPTALVFIPIALVTYIYPYFAEHRMDKRWCLHYYKKILLCLGMFNFLLSMTLYFLAPYIIKYFFGVQYMDALYVFRILSLTYFVSGTFRVLSGNLLVTQRQLGFNLFVAIASGILNIIADYFLISKYGSWGAACANSLVVIVSSILSTAYLVYCLRQNNSVTERG